MICILDGEGDIYIGEEHYRTEKAQIYLINGGVPYRVCSSQGQRIAVINFDGSQEFSHRRDVILSVRSEDFDEKNLLKSPMPPFINGLTALFPADRLELFEELYGIYIADSFTDGHRSFLLSSLLTYIISLATVNFSVKKKSRLAEEIYKYTTEHAEERITVSEIARHFNYTVSYIERLVRRDFGISIKQIIIKARMKKALWMLENTDISCENLASSLGFFSSQHFSQTFKKYYGRAPSYYR